MNPRSATIGAIHVQLRSDQRLRHPRFLQEVGCFLQHRQSAADGAAWVDGKDFPVPPDQYREFAVHFSAHVVVG